MEIEFSQELPDNQIINDLIWSLAYISNVNNIVNQMIDDKVFYYLKEFYQNYRNKTDIQEVYAYVIGIMCKVGHDQNQNQKSIGYFLELEYDQ